MLSINRKLEIRGRRNARKWKSKANEIDWKSKPSDLKVKLARNNGINFDFEIRQGKLSIAMSPLIPHQNSSHLKLCTTGALDITAQRCDITSTVEGGDTLHLQNLITMVTPSGRKQLLRRRSNTHQQLTPPSYADLLCTHLYINLSVSPPLLPVWI